MKLYKLTQSESIGYDTYDSVIVCAENEDDAKSIHPSGGDFIEKGEIYDVWATKKSNINCEEIGVANNNQMRGVVLASFNAG